MSNLINNKPKKKLLDRGPKIVPTEEFKLEETQPANSQTDKPVTEAIQETPKPKRRSTQDITSVRVTKATRSKLNALIQMGKADHVDLLIDILIDEYIDNTLTKDEKKTYGIVLDILRKRER